MTDLDKAMLTRARKKCPADLRLRFVAADAAKLPVRDDYFDRLSSVSTLEHIPQPHRVLMERARVIRPGGVLSVLIPTQGGVLWRPGRALYSRPRFSRRYPDIDYDYVMAREHVNSCFNRAALMRKHFPDRDERLSPFRVPSLDLNLFLVCNLSNGSTVATTGLWVGDIAVNDYPERIV